MNDPLRDALERGAQYLKWHFSRDMILAVGIIIVLAWLTVGGMGRVRGWALVAWLSVPIFLLVGVVSITGPGWLFPKEALEGPTIFTLARKDGVTVLDLVALSVIALGMLVAIVTVVVVWPRTLQLALAATDIISVGAAFGVTVWAILTNHLVVAGMTGLTLATMTITLGRDLFGRRCEPDIAEQHPER